jgi:cathepsin L
MSEQELVDCSSSTGNAGCNGGWYFWSYDWLQKNKTMKESDYPYTAKDGTCKYSATKGITSVSSYGQVKGVSANLAQLAKQPVNVAVAAGNNVF